MNDETQDLLARYQPQEAKVVDAPRQLCAARFAPCGNFLLAGGFDGLVYRWDASSKDLPQLPSLAGHQGWVQGLAFHPRELRAYTADTWGRLCCWPYAEAVPQPAWSIDPAHDGWIRAIAVSPDGGQLATCGTDRVLRMWSSLDGSKLQEISGPTDDPYCLAFHPDGRSLVTGDLRGVVRHWDLATAKCIREFDARLLFAYMQIQELGGVRVLAFDREGKSLACGGAQPTMAANVQGIPTLLLFDWESGKQTRSMALGKSADGFVFDLLWHSDGFWMIVTSGGPGSGQLAFHRPADETPFFVSSKMSNCHAVSMHPSGKRLVVTATNRSSAGNGRPPKDGKYPSNWSPVHVLDFPQA